MDNALYGRLCSLLLVEGDKALDLSGMHITFESRQQDEEHPDNCRIRVHNLSRETVRRIKGEFSRVVLQAGYEGVGLGVIFDGTIRQWGEGREGNRVDTYLDILAADGDLGYNNGFVSRTLAAGSTAKQRIDECVAAIVEQHGMRTGRVKLTEGFGGTLPRGRVLFGLARAQLRGQTQNVRASWNIKGGAVNVTPLDEYPPGQAVVLNALTGLIGRAEQTMDGIKCRCLINPRIDVGGLVHIDNASVNKVTQQKDHVIDGGAQMPYDQWAGLQNLADVTADGLYRVYVCEYRGNNRGPDWYMDLILLSIDPATKKVKAKDGQA